MQPVETSVSRRQFFGATAAASLATGLSLGSVSSLSGAEQDESLKDAIKKCQSKFAVNVEMWWTGLPFMERLKQAVYYGFPAVEFWPLDGKDLPAIARYCEETGLEIAQFTAWGFTPGMNETKNHQDFVAAIRKACDAAKLLKCRKATVVAGNDVPGMTQEQMHANVITALKLAAPIAEEHDLMLILEPMNIRVDHKGHCLYGSTAPLKICDAVGSSHVKINWDLYHMHITEGDLCGHMREGMEKGHIGYLQIADHPGRNEPGTGEIHYNRVLKEAHKLGYHDYIGLECRPTNEIAGVKGVLAADVW